MESYYSSDEEIAWGPVTLREINADLKRYQPRKPNRRHTVLCKTRNTKMDESLSKAMNKLDISGTSTAYYTPNESLKVANNSDFLEKLSHVINVPSSELSEYASVLESTGNTKSQLENTESQNEPLIVPYILISKPDSSVQNDSCMDFIKALENRETQYDIENFQQTLVENSYVPSEEEQITTEEEISVNETNSVGEESEIEEREVIVLSDDSDNSAEDCNVSCDERITSFRKETDEFQESEFLNKYDKTENKYELLENDLGSNGEEQQNEVNESSASGNRINAFEETSYQRNVEELLLTPNMQRQLSTIKEYSTSPVIVPEIDLTQFDDSLKDDSLQLNDTLEEMNRWLNEGLNDRISNDEIVEETPTRKDISTPCNKITSKKQLLSCDRDKTSHIPKRKYIPTSAEKKVNNTYTLKKMSPKTDFKIPEIPFRQKLTTPTPPKSGLNLKNIVSPVALYIKSSPRIPLKQNVPLRELPRIVTTTSTKSSNKENLVGMEFPEVAYKPSKSQKTTTEEPVVVPPYMKKLITEGHITKHEGRLKPKRNDSKVSRKLLQSDVTNTTIDQSLLDNTGDVSVLTNKQAFIK
ncbi:uncharacterized protein LOC108904266 [Anoplophora glabripennis]|uniref:uncharacterized protein LOC108904266 n=1 Tax=Anoplophora glabripennis TaxID=217634 RepID=UPI0008749C4C|nr:uncharacterized protein LOC108904266 [Anoplophora glabripennis]